MSRFSARSLYRAVVSWTLARGDERITCDVRRDQFDDRYRLVMIHQDGSETVESIEQATDLMARAAELLNQLRRDGWTVV